MNKCIWWLFVLTVLPLGGGAPKSGYAEVSVSHHDGKLRVEIDNQLFTEYIYSGFAKPILYPILDARRTELTRNYPIKRGIAGEAEDHPHHTSMWFTHGEVNGVNFWNTGSDKGRTLHEEILAHSSGEREGMLRTSNRWVGPDGEIVCTDTRELRFGKSDGARYIDWLVTMHASHGKVVFGDTKEGMMGIRTHPSLRLRNNPKAGVTSANGNARNSRGLTGSGIWGKRARWVDYSGNIQGRNVGLVIFDHPENLRYPTWWHARDYGLIAANPFGIHHFESKPKGTGDWTLPDGTSRKFRYRFLFYEDELAAPEIEQHFTSYAKPAEDRVLPAGELPDDKRLTALKDLNGYFPFSPPASVEAWKKRRELVRRQILVSMGLWPMPERPAVRATIHGKVDRDDYTVERVYLESYPGHFVTGSLYRPKSSSRERRPAVLSPHGHFSNGRFHDHGVAEVRRQIVQGAERFEVSGRHPLQARCVQLARMGCVVFHYDMVGYADSKQISEQVAHRHAERRPDFEGLHDWGFYSAQAEMRLQNVMGLQTFNSLRALDFLSGLPDVDPQRLAVTGASGGGTQTMILSAIDPRVAVSFPAVMVSTAMQGGCTCENASLLRIGTGNVEFAGLFAPKPLGMTSADDWTVEFDTKGFPELQKLYDRFQKRPLVSLASLTHFGHNFNYVSRAAMYAWLNKHLDLGFDEPIVEEDFHPLSIEEMSVWNDEHPQPLSGPAHERALMQEIDRIAQRQLAEKIPTDADSLREYRQLVRGAVHDIIGRDLAEAGTVRREKARKTKWTTTTYSTICCTTIRTVKCCRLYFCTPKRGTDRSSSG